MEKCKALYKIVTAVEDYELLEDSNDILVFLAGGICQCENWQDKVIQFLTTQLDNQKMKDDNENKLILFNPRRDYFPINNLNESRTQIEWEFKWLNKMNLFSMYFDNSPSVQPICFYELGRYLLVIKQQYPSDFDKRIIISYKDGFSRSNDVEIQTRLATEGKVKVNKCSPNEHGEFILSSFMSLKKK